MGKAIKSFSKKNESIHIIGEINKEKSLSSVGNYKNADCVIDFSSHLICGEVCAFCCAHSLPLVIGTTGHTENELKIIESASEKIPIFFSENMSFCMQMLRSFVRTAAENFRDFDSVITETHRKGKADSPSKTALMLKGETEKCSGGNISPQIFSIRKDNCAGKHEITFFGEDEEITFIHTCFDREAYAKGAVKAAEFIITKKKGLYTSDSLIF